MATLIGTGGQTLNGTATNAFQTDTFTLYGQGNTVDAFGGNEVINGGSMAPEGYDNATYIHIGSTKGASPPSNFAVTDDIVINGGNNTLTGDGTLTDEARTFATGSAVTAAVAVFSGANVSYTINGQGSTIGGDYVGVDNVSGSTTVTVDGPSDVLYVNDDASNVITTGPTAGYAYLYMDSPEIGSRETLNTGYSSTITLGGNGNYVFGSEANHTLTIGGTVAGTVYGNNDDVTLGNGNNSITVSGVANQIIVGSGSNTINAGSGNALVALEFFGRGNGTAIDTVTVGGGNNVIDAPQTASLVLTGGANGSNTVGAFIGGGVTYTANGNDSVTLGGPANTVVLGNGADTVTLTGTLGGNAVTLGNGRDTVVIGGASNNVTLGNGNDTLTLGGSTGGNNLTLGNGNDTVSAGGNSNNITLGSGNDTLTATGLFNAITVNGTAASSDSLTIGAFASGTITGGGDTVTIGNFDTFTLVGLQPGSTLTLGTTDAVFLNANADVKATFGSGDSLTINGSATYTGIVELTNFSASQTLDLEGLTNAQGTRINSLAAFDSSLRASGSNEVLALQGGGTITFDNTTVATFTTADVKFN